jgi:methylglutaconyl-CoA hydratase
MNTIKVSLKNSGKVVELNLARPEVRNSFNEVLIDELHQTITAVGKREGQFQNARVVVLSGEGKVFCGGGDLNWMKRSLSLSHADNLEDCQKLTRMFLALDRCPMPIIGAIRGFAIGGGVGLVSICDHVLATEEAVFSLSEVKLGLIPACIGPFVIGKIGTSAARSLFLTGERFNAKKALDIGLIHEIVSEENLNSRLDQVITRVIEGGPKAIEAAKLLIHTLSRDLIGDFHKQLDFAASELAQLRVQEEAVEGVSAFLEKRPPNWKAR